MVMHMTKNSVSESGQLLNQLKRNRVFIAVLLLMLGAAYAVVPQLSFFSESWDIVRASNIVPMLLALIMLLVSFGCAAAVYMQLSPKRLVIFPTYMAQIAGSFAGKVLPAGIGAVSVSFLYLVRQGVSKGSAATVVGANNLLGYIGHTLWFMVALALMSESLREKIFSGQFANSWLVGLIAITVLCGIIVGIRQYKPAVFHDILSVLRQYRKQPNRILLALLASMLLTASYVTMLWLSSQAVNGGIDWFACLIALTTGVIAQSITPTPGGIGGAEIGLVAGLSLVGLDVNLALAVALLNRLVTYWVPLLLGWLALLFVVRRRYI